VRLFWVASGLRRFFQNMPGVWAGYVERVWAGYVERVWPGLSVVHGAQLSGGKDLHLLRAATDNC
jgi:hypothetical protein